MIYVHMNFRCKLSFVTCIKLVRIVQYTRNSEDTKENRKLYVKWFNSNQNKIRPIYVDETCFNRRKRRLYERSKKGYHSVARISGQICENVTVCMTISLQQGLIYVNAYNGSINAERFQEFVQELFRTLEGRY